MHRGKSIIYIHTYAYTNGWMTTHARTVAVGQAVQFILLTNANPAALSPSLSDSRVISITRTRGYRVIHN